MSTVNSPCAACKFLRRKCMQGCIFAPYFPPENPARFSQVHRVFGASNVAKLLNDLTPSQREDAVNSLAYEAEARLHDPVYGCAGYISLLQHRLLQLQRDLLAAKKELSACIRAAEFGPPPFGPHNQFYADAMGVPVGQGSQLAEAIAAARDHVMMRSIENQHEMARLMGGGNIGVGVSPLSLVSPPMAGFEGSFEGALGPFQEDGRRGVGPSS